MAEEEKQELPPIVMIPEAQFMAKQLQPQVDEIKATLAADVVTFDKVQTKTILEKAIGREEIKDEDFTPFYEQMFIPEAGNVEAVDKAGPLSFDDAIECCLRYAVSIK